MQTEVCVLSGLHLLPSSMLTFETLIWENALAVHYRIMRIRIVTDHQKYGNCKV
jgi:hypothetical protein